MKSTDMFRNTSSFNGRKLQLCSVDSRSCCCNCHSNTLSLCLRASVAAEKDFVGASLVSVLHKLLSDERSAPEIKYNSMILLCAVMGSGEAHQSVTSLSDDWCHSALLMVSPLFSPSEPLHKEVQNYAFIDVVSQLRAHENKTVSHQASLTEQRLTAQS